MTILREGLQVLPVTGMPEVHPGDDLAALITERVELFAGDVVVVASKIVSKAEGCIEYPRPGETEAQARARVVREQSIRLVADAPWVTISETAQGYVCANAGVDASNVPGAALVVLPEDCDASAARLRAALRERSGNAVGVIIADTFGRPWRLGQTDVALGVSGISAVRSEIGALDREGRELAATEVALADELASAADLVRGKADGVPVVVIRGLDFESDDAASGQDLLRPPELDLFPRGRGGLGTALLDQPPTYGAPVDARDLGRAQTTVELICGAGVRVRQVRPRLRRSGTELHVSGEEPTMVGLAGGLLLALLVDLGYGAVLVEAAPAPTIWAGRPLAGPPRANPGP